MDKQDKRRLFFMSCLSVFNGVLGAAGVASVLPFIGLVSDPDQMNSSPFILFFSQVTGIESHTGLIITFASLSIFLIVFGNLMAAVDDWYGELFGAQKDRDLSVRLLNNWLTTDALEFEKKKNAERAKEILSDVDRIIIDTLFSMLNLLSGLTNSIFIVVLLMWVDWRVTLVVFGILVFVHCIIHIFTSSRLSKLGEKYTHLESKMFNHVIEALLVHKEIKLNDIPRFFVDRFSRSCKEQVKINVEHSLIKELPNRFFEMIAFSTVLLIAVYFSLFSDSDSNPMTLIGMYAFAAYRLMPAIASVIGNLEDIWFDSANLEGLVQSLEKTCNDRETSASDHDFRHSVALSDITFRFSEHGPFFLNRLNLHFPANKMTCIKGRTGCGKSTVLYLISGLYQPSAGCIKIDESSLNVYENREWKKQVGFVPSLVHILHLTIYENIAMGETEDEIDREKVKSVAVQVDLDRHIMELDQGYNSIYGKDGLSFSSGQIQKIGLARALYRNPKLLLLDESTNAFDLKTENEVLSNLKQIEDLTIIFVSHRPSVFEHADKLINLEELIN
jgi:ABC-type bacteriocin/lantibiotic exporter with double-glycine peptidase domain